MSTPEPDDGSVDVEAAWAEIVARWDDPPHPGSSGATGPPDTGGGTAGTEVAPDGDTRAAGAAGAGRGRGGHPGTGVDGSAAGTAGTARAPAAPGPGEPQDVGQDGADDWTEDWEPPRSHVGGERVLRAAQDDERRGGEPEGFVPPEPPPLPRGDLPSRLAWGGVLGAPLFFLVCALFWRDVPGLLVVAGIAAFVAGFGALVVRMPANRDDGDDGAVV